MTPDLQVVPPLGATYFLSNECKLSQATNQTGTKNNNLI